MPKPVILVLAYNQASFKNQLPALHAYDARLVQTHEDMVGSSPDGYALLDGWVEIDRNVDLLWEMKRLKLPRVELP